MAVRFFFDDFRVYAKQLERAANPRAVQLAIRAGVVEGAIVYERTLREVLRTRHEKHPSKNKPRLKTRVRRRVLSQRRYAPNVYFEVGTYGPARHIANQPPAGVRLRFLEGTTDRWTGGRNDAKGFTPGAYRGRIKGEGLIDKMEARAGARALTVLEEVALAQFQRALA